MLKRDYYILALKAGEYKRRAWVISVFSKTDGESSRAINPYPYQVSIVNNKYAFRNPENLEELIVITDSDASIPLFNVKDKIVIGYSDAENLPKNLKQSVETTYGNVFFNYLALIYPFGNKIPFQTGRVNIAHIEETIATLLTDIPPEGEVRKSDLIYVDEYLNFTNAVFSLTGFTQLWVPGATPKTMTADPAIKKLKAELLEKYKDKLHDPATIAKIEEELVSYDKDVWLKGDRGLDFLISKKSIAVVRKKRFLMYGVEKGLEDGVGVTPITNSLSEGWDIEKFPELNNALRSGSFNRGAQTMLGGEAVKWLLRASSNISITEEDCGTTLGNKIHVTKKNYKQIIDRNIVTPKGPQRVTAEDAEALIGKSVIVRSPMFCKLDKTDYCAICCGKRLADHPKGLSVAVADYGSAFLGLFMAAMHAKQLETAKLDINDSFI